MEYDVLALTAADPHSAARSLAREVRSRCRDGWEPAGGVQVLAHGREYVFVQAVVRPAEAAAVPFPGPDDRPRTPRLAETG